MIPVSERPPGRSWVRSGAAVLSSYVLVFGVLAAPWLREAADAIPGGDYGSDSVLIVWVLAWVAHALLTCPTEIASPPINFPAPQQLTGTEHFGSTQLVFAPVFWSTHNAVLGANVAAFLSYPLAAFAMQRLLLALGCRAAVAWVAGLLFALGPLRVPATLHVLQYANVFLPLVVLGLVRLFQRPSATRASLLFSAFLVGFFSSYYAVVLVGLVAAVWSSTRSRGVGRRRARSPSRAAPARRRCCCSPSPRARTSCKRISSTAGWASPGEASSGSA